MIPVPLPQLGVNDTSATVIEWARPEGTLVTMGQALCTVETTKANVEVEAPATGYLVQLAEPGREVSVGDAIAVLLPDPPADIEAARRAFLERQRQESAPAAGDQPAHVTMKARLLAKELGVAIEEVPPVQGRVNEEAVRAWAMRRKGPTQSRPDLTQTLQGPLQRLLIIGAGQGAVQVLDAIRTGGTFQAVGIIDDNAQFHNRFVMGVPVLGASAIVEDLWSKKAFDAAVISISTSIPARRRLFERFSSVGVRFANIIHPTVAVGGGATLGAGNIFLAFGQIGPYATVGDNNFVSAYCSIEHHCQLASHCSFGPAVVMSSSVRIADGVRFGTGIFIEPFVTIGAESVIASGAILRQHVPERSIVKVSERVTIRPREETGGSS